MFQSIIVALIVTIAACYAVWTLSPLSLRLRLFRWLDARLAASTAPAAAVLRARLVAPLLQRAAPAGGCASCSNAPEPPVHIVAPTRPASPARRAP
jgi:hypothetical protein